MKNSAKKRRRRRNAGGKITVIVLLVFIIGVAAAIGIAMKLHERKYYAYVAQQEAERQALLDVSWIDTDATVSWIAHQNISEKDAEGDYWTTMDDNLLLRTYSFADGSTRDISLNDLRGYAAQIVPADDPRGFVLADWDDDVWSFYRIDENDQPAPLFYGVQKDVEWVLGWYDGDIYCNVESDIRKQTGADAFFGGYETFLARWDASDKAMNLYRGEGLCVDANGRAAVLEGRSTGIMEYAGGHTDENGQWVDDYSEMEGWTLGVEDAQGGWTAIAPVGGDSELKKVSGAAWLDGDHLLIAARTSEEGASEKECHLFSYTLSTGKFEPWMLASGEVLCLGKDSYIWENSLSVSPYGRYIAYNNAKTGFKEDSAVLWIQSLETGRHAQLSPRDPVVEGEQKISTDVANKRNIQIWQ